MPFPVLKIAITVSSGSPGGTLHLFRQRNTYLTAIDGSFRQAAEFQTDEG